MLCSLGFHKPKCKPLFLGEQRSNTQKGRASIPTHSKPAESQEAVASSELCSLVSAPALPPPFTLKELELPLIDAQTCDTYYHENSYVPSQEPIILEDMLCAGFESGQKDACGVSKHFRWGPQGRRVQYFFKYRVN